MPSAVRMPRLPVTFATATALVAMRVAAVLVRSIVARLRRRRRVGTRLIVHVAIRIVTRAAGFGARRVLSATAVTAPTPAASASVSAAPGARSALLGTATRILVRLVLTQLAA